MGEASWDSSRGEHVRVAPTTDLEAVRALGVANGLDEGGRDDRSLVAAWAARTADGAMVGAVALEEAPGLAVVNWLSVEAAFRGRGLATRLLAALEDEARRRGVQLLWATARAPGFFLANGFVPVDEGPEVAYLLGECPDCPQYGRECRPRAVVKDLG